MIHYPVLQFEVALQIKKFHDADNVQAAYLDLGHGLGQISIGALSRN